MVGAKFLWTGECFSEFERVWFTRVTDFVWLEKLSTYSIWKSKSKRIRIRIRKCCSLDSLVNSLNSIHSLPFHTCTSWLISGLQVLFSQFRVNAAWYPIVELGDLILFVKGLLVFSCRWDATRKEAAINSVGQFFWLCVDVATFQSIHSSSVSSIRVALLDSSSLSKDISPDEKLRDL